MDMNSWKLATDKGLPHSVVVAKLKKYRRWSDKPLMLFREGSHDGAIIYSFDDWHDAIHPLSCILNRSFPNLIGMFSIDP